MIHPVAQTGQGLWGNPRHPSRWSSASRATRHSPKIGSPLCIELLGAAAGVTVENQPLWCLFLPTAALRLNKVLIQLVRFSHREIGKGPRLSCLWCQSGWTAESWDLIITPRLLQHIIYHVQSILQRCLSWEPARPELQWRCC